jgi:hypothetical protein
MVEYVAATHPSGSRTAPVSTYAADGPDLRFFRKRISWGAVLAGVIIILAVQLLLSMLGIGIGASTIDPTADVPSGSSLGIGAGLWWAISALIAVFVGSYVAGRLAGSPDRTDGMLHGLVTWGLSTLVVFWMLTTTLSSLIGGAFNVVGSALQTAAQGAVAGTTAGAATQAAEPGDPVARIERQIEQLLARVAPQAEQTTQQIGQAISDDRVRETVLRVITAGPEAATSQDRQTAVDALVQYGGMSRPEAEQQLAQWEAAYANAKEEARRTAEASADAVAQGALWSFFAFALGAVVAVLGGLVGTPRALAVGRGATTRAA